MSETFRHKRVAIDFDGTLVEESNDINEDFERRDKPERRKIYFPLSLGSKKFSFDREPCFWVI